MYQQYLKVVTINGRKGVISQIKIQKNTPICEFRGEIYSSKELEGLRDKININDVLQITPSLYLGPSGNADDHIRHSCNPNCVVHASGRRAILYSLYLIMPNNEITFDYSTTSTDDLNTWQMECKCKDPNCRGIISGFYNLNKDLQDKYKTDEIAPLFIREPIFR